MIRDRLPMLVSLVALGLALPAAAARPDGRLAYLLTLRNELAAGRSSVEAARMADPATAAAIRTAADERFAGSLRFADAPAPADLAALADLGVEFFDFGRGPAGSRTVFPCTIPFAALPAVMARPGLAAVEAAWRPASPPPLARSRPQVQTDSAWAVLDPDGEPLTGDGVLIADFDTGVLYRHPMLFHADGGRFAWLDVNQNGAYGAGDAVDLDGDGLAEAGEALRYVEAAGTTQYGNVTGVFNLRFDFLYADANGDLDRDAGPPAYGEDDPSLGEPWFIVDDADGDGVLDPGEQLIGLGTSKLRAIYGRDGTIRRRGVDLLQAETDWYGHGTPVTGIFGGGWPGRHAMSGVAPGAESVHVVVDYAAEPPLLVPIEAGLAWARDEGARVILIEDGEWAWEYLDGSSNTEIMLNELAADGLIVVVPAGNLASSTMHTAVAGNATTDLVAVAASVSWVDLLWRDAPADLPIALTPPGGAPILVPVDGSIVTSGTYQIYGRRSTSPRGTHRQDVRLSRTAAGSLAGTWRFALGGDANTVVHGYFFDNASSWASPNTWAAPIATHTVTWPATADSAISVAAYNPANDGGINGFSGWGPRLDGRPAVDLAAPGSTTYSISGSTAGNFTSFGGTSAAGPHVAGAVALLAQLVPDLGSGGARVLLRRGAAQDQHTTDIDRWGAGKLRIHAALEPVLAAIDAVPPALKLAVTAVPNPFNATTTLRFELPDVGDAVVRVFSADGRQVWSRRVDGAAAGRHEVAWHGVDGRGRAVASGVYLVHVSAGGCAGAARVALVK